MCGSDFCQLPKLDIGRLAVRRSMPIFISRGGFPPLAFKSIDDLQSYGNDTVPDHMQTSGGTFRHVDDPSGPFAGATVVDDDFAGNAIDEVGHYDFGPER